MTHRCCNEMMDNKKLSVSTIIRGNNMTFNIKWETIENGFRGFEKLAYEYVADILPNKTWKRTQETRDGNKDACAIFMGYQPIGSEPTQWWMEAKYSEKSKNITRYRLDNTLVSAILEKNVSKVIFVTNISIKPKTIMDIRNALSTAIHCNDVQFATRYTLGWWLLKNPDIYNKYFKEKPSKKADFPLFLIDEAEFFPYSKKYSFQSQSYEYLNCGEKYLAYFMIFSPVSQQLQVCVGEPYKEKIRISSTILKVNEGVNECNIAFEILPDSSCFTISGNIFEIGNLPVISKITVDVLKKNKPHLEISSQGKIYRDLKQALGIFRTLDQTHIHYIKGDSGTGKSYIIERFINSESFEKSFVYWNGFTESSVDNCKKLLNLILFILFPYIDSETVDDKYLDSIDKRYISKYLVELVAAKNDFEKLYHIFSNLRSNQIFPDEIGKEKRYIIIDDIQNLDKKLAIAFNSILKKMSHKNFPIFIVMIGQNCYYDSASFQEFRHEVVTIYKHDCSLLTKDILSCLNQNYNFAFQLDEKIIKILFPTVIDILFFTKYIREQEEVIDTLEDFQFIYRAYMNNSVGEKYILNKFEELFRNDSLARDICHNVYWSLNGCNFNERTNADLRLAIGKLMENQLVKLDGDNHLIPYHDKYKYLYRRNFQEYLPQVMPEFHDDTEKMRFIILCSQNISELKKAYDYLDNFRKQSSFFILLDILEILFEEHNHVQIILRFGNVLYFKYFYLYTIAATNCSDHVSGKQGFYQLYSESKAYEDFDIKCIWIKAAWELCNSCYEHLEFENALKYAAEIKENILWLEMTRASIIHENFEEYYSAMVIKNLIDSERNTAGCYENYIALNREIDKTPFRIRCFSHQIRYIQTLYMRETDKSILMLERCMDKLLKEFDQENKYYLWCGFDYNFLKFIVSGEKCYFSKMYRFLETLKKNFFNDYRKRLLAVFGILYCKNMKNEGNKIIFENMAINREMRPRFRGFYDVLMAVYNLFYLNSKEEAVRALRNSLKIFDGLKEYQKIILHNIHVIETTEIDNMHLSFCVNNDFSGKNCIYLDPRSCW